jgi:4-hydroxy-tetrahydrodipicolinate reductase
MGRLVIAEAQKSGFVIENKVSEGDDINDLFKNSDVIIDFSVPIATKNLVIHPPQVPLVIGTTGLSDEHMNLMLKHSKSIPVFYSTNMSLLVMILNTLVHTVSCFLDEKFDVEILDIHHRLKKDAPSGTALMLGKTVAKARKQNFQDVARFSRYDTALRKAGEIGFAVQRYGNINGIHEVSFCNEQESLKLRHEAQSREVFAKGALKIAEWLVTKPSGFYNMNDFANEQIKNFCNL